MLPLTAETFIEGLEALEVGKGKPHYDLGETLLFEPQ